MRNCGQWDILYERQLAVSTAVRIEGCVSGVLKMLLLVNSPPWGSGTGEQYLRSLAAHLPQGSLCRYSTVQQATPGGHQEWVGFPSAVARLRSSALPILSSIAYGSFRLGGLERLLRDVIAFSERESPQLLWASLSSPAMYLLAHRVAASLNIPLVSSVLDPPGYLAANMRFDPFTRNSVREEFSACLLASRRVAVVSEEMAEEYGRDYGAVCTVIRSGIHPSLWAPERRVELNPEELVIGFAGSMYGKSEWRALLRSIESTKGVLRGRRIRIRFVGRWPRLGVPRRDFVEHYQPVSPAEAIRLMSEVDLCYLPYWFDRRYAETVEMSFPSKLPAYVAAGRPVLYHGPAESTPARFLKRYPVGVSCHSNQPAALLEAIERCVWDTDLRRGYSAARSRALEVELGLEAMVCGFADFLGVERSELAPLRRAD
jgi:glycosyltransferase involved in cell wall biosynthesis